MNKKGFRGGGGGGMGIMRRKRTEVAFFCPRVGMQVSSLRLMTSKLVSLVAQVTLHPNALRSIPDIVRDKNISR